MSHTITIAASGHRYTCRPDQELLRAGLDAGLCLPYSCRSGVCNSCRGRVVQGEVDLGDVHPKYLSMDERAQGYALLCQARPRGDVVVDVEELDPAASVKPRYLPSRILALQPAAPDVMIVTLGLPINEPQRFIAGQYLDFIRPDGRRRSYSIASAPRAEGVRQVELHIRHQPGGAFTDRVFGSMRPREVHKIEFPLGSFRLRDKSDAPIVLLASGTGFAPMKAILADAFQRGLRRPITLYWGGRRRRDLYMAKLCERWAREQPTFRFVPVLSEPAPDCRWTGRTGLVHEAVMQDLPDLRHHEVYACGAPPMVEAARHDFTARCGLLREAFFADAFLTARDKAAA